MGRGRDREGGRERERERERGREREREREGGERKERDRLPPKAGSAWSGNFFLIR